MKFTGYNEDIDSIIDWIKFKLIYDENMDLWYLYDFDGSKNWNIVSSKTALEEISIHLNFWSYFRTPEIKALLLKWDYEL